MEFSNLPRDMVEEILSKLSGTSLRATRLTCKNWNPSFKEKHIISEEAGSRESMVMMLMDYKVYLMDINLHGIRNNVDPSIKRKGKLISLNGLDDLDGQVQDMFQIFHCDGLLLCVTKDENKKLVVWNPYYAEKRWIDTRFSYYTYAWNHYAIGYEKKKETKKNRSCSIYKILRFYHDGRTISRWQIYALKTNSWRVLDMTPPEWYPFGCSVSIKGNTYWIASKIIQRWDDITTFLICFDFTRERFGLRLPLPFKSYIGDNVGLSSVREEQLVVLIQHSSTCAIEIWVSYNIDPQMVSWNKLFFATMDMMIRPNGYVSFFIDEMKKIAVVIGKNNYYTRHIAYIIGENGYIRQVDLGEVTNNYYMSYNMSSSYFVHIKKPKKKQIIF